MTPRIEEEEEEGDEVEEEEQRNGSPAGLAEGEKDSPGDQEQTPESGDDSSAQTSETTPGTVSKQWRSRSYNPSTQMPTQDLADKDSLYITFRGVDIHYKRVNPPRAQPLPSPTGLKPMQLSSRSTSANASEGATERMGTPVLLLHDFAMSTFAWEGARSSLAEQLGGPVVAFDRPGFGLTERVPPGPTRDWLEDPIQNPYTMQYSVEATLMFAWHLSAETGKSPVIIGHSAGALVAVQAVLASPHLFTALVLVDPLVLPPIKEAVKAKLAGPGGTSGSKRMRQLSMTRLAPISEDQDAASRSRRRPAAVAARPQPLRSHIWTCAQTLRETLLNWAVILSLCGHALCALLALLPGLGQPPRPMQPRRRNRLVPRSDSLSAENGEPTLAFYEGGEEEEEEEDLYEPMSLPGGSGENVVLKSVQAVAELCVAVPLSLIGLLLVGLGMALGPVAPSPGLFKPRERRLGATYLQLVAGFLRRSIVVRLMGKCVFRGLVPMLRVGWRNRRVFDAIPKEGYTKWMLSEHWDQALVEYTIALAVNPKSGSQLPLLRCPALVVTGASDGVVPAWNAERVAKAIPGAAFRSIKGCGHMPQQERASEFTEAVCEFVLPLCPVLEKST